MQTWRSTSLSRPTRYSSGWSPMAQFFRLETAHLLFEKLTRDPCLAQRCRHGVQLLCHGRRDTRVAGAQWRSSSDLRQLTFCSRSSRATLAWPNDADMAFNFFVTADAILEWLEPNGAVLPT